MAAPRRTATLALLVALTTVACSTSQDTAPARTAPIEARPSVVPVPPTPGPATPDAPVVMTASAPVRVEIAAIGVDSDLMELGIAEDGTLEVPPTGFPAGWFTGGPTPGELGPAVIAGHIDWITGPGVFYRLGSLAPGDDIRVTRADGTVATFRTVRVAQFPKDAFPTELVYGDIDHAGLRLISCGGAFNRGTGHYEDNIVVFADLLPPA